MANVIDLQSTTTWDYQNWKARSPYADEIDFKKLYASNEYFIRILMHDNGAFERCPIIKTVWDSLLDYERRAVITPSSGMNWEKAQIYWSIENQKYIGLEYASRNPILKWMSPFMKTHPYHLLPIETKEHIYLLIDIVLFKMGLLGARDKKWPQRVTVGGRWVEDGIYINFVEAIDRKVVNTILDYWPPELPLAQIVHGKVILYTWVQKQKKLNIKTTTGWVPEGES